MVKRDKPHDRLFRAVFGRPEQLTALLRALAPSELAARIDWSTLRLEDARLLDTDLGELQPDLVAAVELYDGGRLVFIVEHLSSLRTTPTKVERKLLSIAAHGFATEVEMYFVVVVHAERSWPPQRRLEAAPQPGTVRVDPLVLDLSDESDAALSARALPAYGRLALLCLKYSRSGIAFRDRLHAWVSLARATISEHGAAAIEPVLSYIHQASQLEPDDIAEWAAAISPEVEEINVTSAERLRQEGMEQGKALGIEQGKALGIEQGKALGIEQGKALGIEQGKALGIEQGKARGVLEGEARLLEKLLTRRFGTLDADTVARVRAADATRLERWAERVLDAATLDEVFGAGD